MTARDNWPDDGIVLYDGVCVLCSRWVRFVVSRDRDRIFRFTPIQSPYGRAFAVASKIDPDDPDTNAVLVDGRLHVRSSAAIAILSRLPRLAWARHALLVPAGLRDAIYTLVARTRYLTFGRLDSCDMGDGRFLDRVIFDFPECPENGGSNVRRSTQAPCRVSR